MLVLTRKLQQQIKIGDQITLTILRVKGNTVRVGVEAPREVRVVRGELPKSGASEEVVNLVDDESPTATTAREMAVPEKLSLQKLSREKIKALAGGASRNATCALALAACP